MERVPGYYWNPEHEAWYKIVKNHEAFGAAAYHSKDNVDARELEAKV